VASPSVEIGVLALSSVSGPEAHPSALLKRKADIRYAKVRRWVKRRHLGEPGVEAARAQVADQSRLEHFLADLNRRGIPKGLEF